MEGETNEEFVILKAMPKILYIEVEQGLNEPFPGLPDKWFPMKPVETYWTLDADEHIELARRGFPLVPNFSTTIDGATGQTLKSSLPDLGDFGSVPSYHASMRGYIAISRVTAADNMLIARSFSPLLFRLGAPPFPSLLFQALNGEMDDMKEQEFIQICMETERDSKAKMLLKDALWKCSGPCGKELLWDAYFVADKQDNKWQILFEKRICRPGALRKCRRCDPNADNKGLTKETHPCDLCGLRQSQEEYARSVWHHKSSRRTLCNKCCEPQCRNPDCKSQPEKVHWLNYPTTLEERDSWLCSACKQPDSHCCDLCTLRLPEACYTSSMWHNKNAASQRTLCNACCQPKCCNAECKSQTEKVHWLQYPKTLEERDDWHCFACRHPCDLCKEMLPKKAYTDSMWKHRVGSDQRTLCNDCCRPPCTRTQCKTCKICRNAGEGGEKVCRRRHCTEAIVSLHWKQLPRAREELNQWLCLQCRFIVCQICRKEITRSIQRSRKSSGAETFKPCGDCQNLEESKRVRQKYT